MIMRASCNAAREVGHGLDADVHADKADVGEFNRDRLGNNLLTFDRLVTVNYLVVGWKQKNNSLLFRTFLNLQRRLQHAVFDQRLANRKSFSFQKRVSHRAADQDLVDAAIDQRVDDRDLVGDFCAAEDCDKRMFRIVNRSAEIVELFFHQQPGRGFGDVMSDADG